MILAGAKTLARRVCPRPLLAWRETRYLERYGEIELNLVKHLCQRDRDAIDVGAHEGYYTRFMIGHARRVYAFEPIPWLARSLARKFARRVSVSAVALSSASGTAELHIPLAHGEPVTGLSSLAPSVVAGDMDRWKLPVRTEALDDIYAGDAGFLKIDVEGQEERVLEGARRTIARCRPRVLIELEERHCPGSPARVRDFFARQGYGGFFVHRGRLRGIADFDPLAMQRADDIPHFAAKDKSERTSHYVNNFIFLPADALPRILGAIEEELARRRRAQRLP